MTTTPTLREVVAAALDAAWLRSTDAVGQARPPDLAGHLAPEIADALKAAGYSVHRSGECVHPRIRRDDLGREMTTGEMIALGVTASETAT